MNNKNILAIFLTRSTPSICNSAISPFHLPHTPGGFQLDADIHFRFPPLPVGEVNRHFAEAAALQLRQVEQLYQKYIAIGYHVPVRYTLQHFAAPQSETPGYIPHRQPQDAARVKVRPARERLAP